MHPLISGNKLRKLKYNLKEAQRLKKNTLLTFGGAFSNHIAATAAAGKEYGFKTIGIIRGEELQEKIRENPTLRAASACGMELVFLSREEYKKRNERVFLELLRKEFGDPYILPEGGTNALAVAGCKEILSEADAGYDYICVPVGTGGTVAGIIEASQPHQQVIGVSVLKGIFQISEIKKYTERSNFTITDAYCFGGYGKIDSKLIRFINAFNKRTGILLDPLYTGKMMFGITDMINTHYFPENSRILAIHTGGLQGIEGMNQLLKKKDQPQIIT